MEGESIEKDPEVTFEHDCPIEELAAFTWRIHAEEHGLPENSVPQGSEEIIKGFLAEPNATELILRKNEELIGCAFSFEENKEELEKEVPYANLFTRNGERVFKIKGVNIKRECRKQGFGRMIMNKIMSETRRKGATKFILSTPKKTDPIPARRLYEKLGFKEVAPNQQPDSFYMQYEYPEEK